MDYKQLKRTDIWIEIALQKNSINPKDWEWVRVEPNSLGQIELPKAKYSSNLSKLVEDEIIYRIGFRNDSASRYEIQLQIDDLKLDKKQNPILEKNKGVCYLETFIHKSGRFAVSGTNTSTGELTGSNNLNEINKGLVLITLKKEKGILTSSKLRSRATHMIEGKESNDVFFESDTKKTFSKESASSHLSGEHQQKFATTKEIVDYDDESEWEKYNVRFVINPDLDESLFFSGYTVKPLKEENNNYIPPTV